MTAAQKISVDNDAPAQGELTDGFHLVIDALSRVLDWPLIKRSVAS